MWQGGVFVLELVPGGPAEKAGGLQQLDRITKLGEVELVNLSHSEAQAALRAAPDKVTVHFDRPVPGPQLEEVTVTLQRKAGKGLGISLVGRRDGPGVFISSLVPGTVAATSDQLVQGDQILRVNEKDLSKSTQVSAPTNPTFPTLLCVKDAAVAVLKLATGDIKVVVRRLKLAAAK